MGHAGVLESSVTCDSYALKEGMVSDLRAEAGIRFEASTRFFNIDLTHRDAVSM